MTNQQMEVLEYYTVLLNKEENRNLSLKLLRKRKVRRILKKER